MRTNGRTLYLICPSLLSYYRVAHDVRNGWPRSSLPLIWRALGRRGAHTHTHDADRRTTHA